MNADGHDAVRLHHAELRDGHDQPDPATPTITPGGPTTFCAGGSVTLTSSSASGNQWYLNGNPIGGATNQTYIATASGDYTTVVTNSGCSSAPSTATTVTVNPTPATPTITPGGPTTFCTGGSVTLTSSSASGNQWYLEWQSDRRRDESGLHRHCFGRLHHYGHGQRLSQCPFSATTVTVNPIPATPTITPGGPTTFCAGGSVTLTSSSASGNQWYLDGNPIGGATNQAYVATASGNYTTTVTTSGCTSAPSSATTVTVNPTPATPTITPGGPTTFCTGGSVTLTSSSASGNQWYLNGNPIGGATNQTYIATASGNYTTTVTTSGCTSAPSASTTVTVTTSTSVVINTNDSGAGSLRQAIIDVCDGGTITFDPGLSGQTITLTTGELAINKNLTIQGLGANLLTVSRISAPDFRIFTINSGQTVTISGLTISNGNAVGGPGANSGGGILNSGTLTLIDSVVSGNNASAAGGGISNAGTVTVNNTTVSGNTAPSGAGIRSGITLSGTVNLTLNNSIVSGNNGNGLGAGIFNGSGSGSSAANLTINNSTIAGNINAGSSGGGIYNAAIFGNAVSTLIINNSTISGNSADSGGGIYHISSGVGSTAIATITNTTIAANNSGSASDSGGGIFASFLSSTTTLTLGNTLVASNLRSSGTIASDVSGAVEPASLNNLIGDGTGMTGISHGVNGNQVGTSVAPINPRLGPLANNGGPTQTHALLAGSPALDAGDDTSATNAGLTTDQRGAGFARFLDAADVGTVQTVDIGAFEAKASVEDITDRSTPEETPLSFAFNVGDASAITSVTASSSNATLVPNLAGNLSVTGSGSTRTLNITPVLNQTGTSTITVTVTSATESMIDTFVLTVTEVNDAPVNSVPGAQSVIENSALTFSTINSNVISISDVDAGSSPVQVTLTATNGVVTLNALTGLSFTLGDGANDATMTFTGAISNINAAMNGLVFTSTPGFNGVASIQIITDDQGNTGSGGSLTDTDSVNINVIDGGALAFSSATYTVSESGSAATITVNRTGGSAGEARIDYATSDGTATGGGTDYTTATGTLIFANGVTTQTFMVPINNDAIDEPDETVNLTLSNPQGSGALGTPSTSVLTITDDDAAPSISIDDPAVTEGNSGTVNLVFTVTLSSPSGKMVTVNYATGNNTATAPSDFVAIPTSVLTFNPLETSKQITVLVNGDNDFEANEALEVNLSSPSNATLPDPQGLGFINNDDPQGGTFVFNSANYFTNETLGSITITVNRTGTTTQAASVDYATSDMTASERSDYTTAVGTLDFPIGASSATFTVLVNIDSLAESSELLGLTLSNPSFGAALGTPSSATILIDNIPNAAPNTIDDPGAFVDQHYHDFLNREADALGRQFWITQITDCGVDPTCIEIKRINVSAAFFLSIEFQETGVTAFLTNKAAFGSVLPGYRPFERDTQALQRGFAFGLPGADAVLEANKVAFFNAFVQRTEFNAIFGSLTNDQYVDGLILNTEVIFPVSERDALVNGLNLATETRATVLRKITEKGSFKQAQFNRAFVYMQYVGYLRRSPTDPPDNNLDGFNFWLNKLNQFNGNFVDAEMVQAFISSGEYRLRFGP